MSPNKSNAPEYHGSRCDVGMVERVAVSAWEKGRAAMGEGALEGKGDHGGAISGIEGVGLGGLGWRWENVEERMTVLKRHFLIPLSLSVPLGLLMKIMNSYEGKLIGNYKIHWNGNKGKLQNYPNYYTNTAACISIYYCRARTWLPCSPSISAS